jgi:hypothetical protein
MSWGSRRKVLTWLFQGALCGAEASLIWWLAGSGSSWMSKLLIDCVVGVLGIGFLLHLVVLFIMLKNPY